MSQREVRAAGPRGGGAHHRDEIGRCPLRFMRAIALRFVLGWSLEEVSRVTGAPVNTVRSRVRLAKIFVPSHAGPDGGVGECRAFVP